MVLFTRYSGSFVAKDGAIWTCEISQQSSSAFAVIEDLDFPHSQPLVVEWEKREKHDAVISSSATLRLISPSDRKFIDLYTTKAGSVRLIVKRNGSEWWRGFLDTEFYSEPYAYASGYEVQLTFSDFGILDRLKFNLHGRKSIGVIIDQLLDAAGHGQYAAEELATKFENGSSADLHSVYALCENFYDEEGEAMSCREVIEALLKPFTARMAQADGGVAITDLHTLATASSLRNIYWSSTDSQLGVDKVYNEVKVTFSPYASADVLGGLEYNDISDRGWTNLTTDGSAPRYNGELVYDESVQQPECYSFFPDRSAVHQSHGKWDWRIADFTVFRSTDSSKCVGASRIGASNAYFAITPQGGGSESSGVITGFLAGTGNTPSDPTKIVGTAPLLAHNYSEAFATQRKLLPYVEDRNNTFVKIRMPLLFDLRYNPFTDFSDDNGGADREAHMKEEANIALVPVKVTLYSANGVALYHWENKDIVQYARPADSVKNLLGEWKSGAAQWGDAWLSYYSDDIMTESGVGDWKDNRQCFGVPFWAGTTGRETISFYWKNLVGNYEVQPWWSYESFFKAPAGQYIPYPPVEGYIEIAASNGVWVFATGDQFSAGLSTSTFNRNNRYQEARWELLQLPEVSVVGNTLDYDELASEDAEYIGVLDAEAKEALALDTIVGTLPRELATAKGTILKSDGTQIHKLKRNGVTDTIEQLFIGTMHSQYATRHTTLSGEMQGAPFFYDAWKDAAQPAGKRFMCASAVYDAIENTTDAEFIEVSPDNYEGE